MGQDIALKMDLLSLEHTTDSDFYSCITLAFRGAIKVRYRVGYYICLDIFGLFVPAFLSVCVSDFFILWLAKLESPLF